MKVSTKGRYGLRAMIDLATYSQDSFVSLNSIAQRQDLSINYLEHMFSSLKKAGLVIGLSGSQGGYKLSQKPESITVLMILKVLEGDLSLSTPPGDDDTMLRRFISQKLWNKLEEKINALMDTITLADMIN